MLIFIINFGWYSLEPQRSLYTPCVILSLLLFAKLLYLPPSVYFIIPIITLLSWQQAALAALSSHLSSVSGCVFHTSTHLFYAILYNEFSHSYWSVTHSGLNKVCHAHFLNITEHMFYGSVQLFSSYPLSRCLISTNLHYAPTQQPQLNITFRT